MKEVSDMAIKLPRDAEGREIPLDTVALYDDDGNVHSVRRFIYTTNLDLDDKWINSWIAVVDDYKTAKPEQMHLTTSDSWEKLEEDLGKIANNPGEVVCAYFGREINCCDGCKLERCEYACSNAFLRDVIERIRKLRGDD